MEAIASTCLWALSWGLSAITGIILATVIAAYGTAFVLRAAGVPQNPEMPVFLRAFAPILAITAGLIWYSLALFEALMSALMLIYAPVLLIAGVIFIIAAVSRGIDAAQTMVSPRTATVPKGFLVDWLLPPDRAEEVLVNILGRYPYWTEKYGIRKARIIFVTQSLGSILSYWTDWLLRRLKLLTLITRSS